MHAAKLAQITERWNSISDTFPVQRVITDEQVQDVIFLWKQFEEYNSGKSDDSRAVQREEDKIRNRRFHYFLMKNGSPTGYYAAEAPSDDHPNNIHLDQFFVSPDYRGQGLAKPLFLHFMSTAASLSVSNPSLKGVTISHFREQSTEDQESLKKIKGVAYDFGFTPKFVTEDQCPKSVMPIGATLYDFLCIH